MNKNLIAIIGLVSILTVSFVTPVIAKQDPGGYFTFGIGLGVGQPIEGLAFFDRNAAGQLTFGYTLNDNLSVFLACQGHLFTWTGGLAGVEFTLFNLVPTVKYAFGESKLKPYLTLGAGLNTSTLRDGAFSDSKTAIAAQSGIGLQYALNDRTVLFLEVKFTQILDSETSVGSSSFSATDYSYIPILAGVDFGL